MPDLQNTNMQTSTIADSNPAELFLSETSNLTASIMLVEKACQQYQKVYNKLDVPYSYVSFFFEEFFKYSTMFDTKLKEFFVGYYKYHIKIEDVINNYTQSFYSQHSNIKVTKEEKFLVFDVNISPDLANKMREVTNLNMSAMSQNIVSICKKIDNSDEIVSQVELYERFMIDKVVRGYKFKNLNINSEQSSAAGSSTPAGKKHKKNKAASKTKTGATVEPIKAAALKQGAAANAADSESQKESKKAVTLVGDTIADEYQKGRITKVIIPRLKLPTSYPYSPDKSRIDKAKPRLSGFVSPAKQIVFINSNKIVGIKYSSNFLEKRKATNKADKKKFDWDF